MTGWFKGSEVGSPTAPLRNAFDLQSVRDRFRANYRDTDARSGTPELLPTRLAQACLSVLPVDGAGISVLDDDFRLPLGASDDVASLAERLQFTQGEGPCLEAASRQQLLILDAAELEHRWPVFAAELFARTPFQGIISLPLSIGSAVKGAIDLFVDDPRTLAAVGLAEAMAVSTSVEEALGAGDPDRPDQAVHGDVQSLPIWATGPSARSRRYVWIAVGMTMIKGDVPAPAALGLLRAYAYAHDSVLDDVARSVIEEGLDVLQLQG